LWRISRQFTQNKFANISSDITSFISVSSYSELLLRKYLPLNASIFHIANPVDVRRQEFSWATKSESFVFVGRLSLEKGGVLFATAAEKAGVKPVFVGDGDEKSKILDACPGAIFKGWCSRLDVSMNIQNSRALVFPSLLHETQGLVVAEAAALGVPAIVSNRCAARDAVEDGVTGLLFKHGDIHDLTLKLKLLKDDPSMAIKMGKKAYDKYWANPLTMDKHTSSLISCYRKIISEGL
jgi:glycosyltransferase involved in cell wall biosynthesis